MECPWDFWVDQSLEKLNSMKVLRSLRPISLPPKESLHINEPNSCTNTAAESDELETFDGLRSWDRTSVEVEITESTFQKWVNEIPSDGQCLCNTEGSLIKEKTPIPMRVTDTDEQMDLPLSCISECDDFDFIGDDTSCGDGIVDGKLGTYPHQLRRLLLFSGNDYLGLSSHPTVRKAISKAAQEHGMGPRGSALICGYTNYHRLLESSLAQLKKKEDCLLCPTGFAANMAVMVTLGSLSSLLAAGRKPAKDERVAIFSDALNHASIIDGIRLAERQQEAVVFVYRHCDTIHLDSLLSTCTLKKKVVVTDSLFSMDGDFAPMVELAKLRKKHSFLLVIDDAHGTLVCGKHGGGVAEEYDCEKDVDICVGTLSKAAGCQGGFIACSKKWKQLLQSRGRSFIFSTALPVPVAAAAHAAIMVAKKEEWRRRAIWRRVQEFSALTQIHITSPIISVVIGNEETALLASRHLLRSGFHVTAIRPPTVPPNSCRLRITLSAAHTRDDVKKLSYALCLCIKSSDVNDKRCDNISAKL